MPEPRIRSVDPSTSTDAIEEILERDGVVIIRNRFGHAAIDAMMAELRPHLDRKATGNTDFVGRHTKRLPALLAKSKKVGDFIADDRLLAVVDRFLGPYCDNFTLSSNSLTVIGPNETPQPLHRDDLLFPFEHPTTRSCHVTAFWALSDFRADNGATRIVPGSHRWDDERKPGPAETAPAVMPKGSVCLFLGATYHGGGANVTAGEWRIGMFAGYILGWLRQEQNFYLTVPPAIARELPEKVARLIGYSLHKPFLGFVYDMQDPYALLQGYEEGSEGGSDLYADGVREPVQAVAVRS